MSWANNTARSEIPADMLEKAQEYRARSWLRLLPKQTRLLWKSTSMTADSITADELKGGYSEKQQ